MAATGGNGNTDIKFNGGVMPATYGTVGGYNPSIYSSKGGKHSKKQRGGNLAFSEKIGGRRSRKQKGGESFSLLNTAYGPNNHLKPGDSIPAGGASVPHGGAQAGGKKTRKTRKTTRSKKTIKSTIKSTLKGIYGLLKKK